MSYDCTCGRPKKKGAKLCTPCKKGHNATDPSMYLLKREALLTLESLGEWKAKFDRVVYVPGFYLGYND